MREFKGKRISAYLDAESAELLEIFCKRTQIRQSHVLTGLIKALSGAEPRREEVPVINELKRIFGRRSFFEFIQDIEKALPKGFVRCRLDSESDWPELWTRDSIGVYAFFSPEPNLEKMVGNAFKLKMMHGLKKLFVVALGADEIDVAFVDGLKKTDIYVESFGRIGERLKEV